MYHCHEPGSTFSRQFSYTAGLLESLTTSISCSPAGKTPVAWLHGSCAPQPSDGPTASMGFVPHISLSSRVHYWAQCFSCSLRSAEHRDCSFWPLLSHDLLMEPPAWGWTPSSSLVCRPQISFPQSCFATSLCPGSTTASA